MKIVIDGRMIGWTGIGRYTRNLLDRLQGLDTANQYTVLLLKKDWDTWKPQADNWHKLMVDFAPYSLKEQLLLPFLLYRLKADLVHFPSPNVPFLYLKKHITTIHDLTLVEYKNVRGRRWAYEVKYWLFRLVIRRAAKGSRAVITDAEFVKRQVAERYHVQPSKITAIHLAADLPTDKADRRTAEPPFLLSVGNAYPFKNLERLLDALAILRQSWPKITLTLVGPADYFYELLRQKARAKELEKSVRFAGRAGDDELAKLYRTAALYVFPSLSEGFGLPGLEAMAHSLPVVSSNATCLPEVLGDAAIYFDPKDPKDIAEKINWALDHPAELDRLRQAGLKQIQKYSWEATAQKTLAVYQQALGSKT